MTRIAIKAVLALLSSIFLFASGQAMSHGNVVVILMDTGFPDGARGDLITCSTSGVDDTNTYYLQCVVGGGVGNVNNRIDEIPAGKVMYVNHIAAIPTRLFAGPQIGLEPDGASTAGYLHWFLRLTKDPQQGDNNLVYEIRGYNESEHITFSSPIIRLNPGDRLFAQNLTDNTFTNDLRVLVSGWLI